MFKGVFTALVTPFKEGQVDETSLERLVQHQLDNGIEGLVVCGTTAESPTLSKAEKFKILELVCEVNQGKVPILFGSGSNNTQQTIELSKEACQHPIDGLLVVVPYYNKPPQRGLVAHFQAVADACSKPLVLYNVPGRTVVSLSPESVISLATHSNIVGIKEADGNLNHFAQYKNQVPQNFSLLSGDDESCVEFCLQGGHGVISVCSHMAPKPMQSWIERARKKDPVVSEEFRSQWPWIQGLYISANPIPVKYGLKIKGVIDNDSVRLPLVEMTEQEKQHFDKVFSPFPEVTSL